MTTEETSSSNQQATNNQQTNRGRSRNTRQTNTPSPTNQTDKQAQRRGCTVFVLSTLLGTVFGALATLGVLFYLNGTLFFVPNNTGLQTELGRIESATDTLNAEVGTLNEQISVINTQLSDMQTQLETINSTSSGNQAELQTLTESMSQTQTQINDIQTRFDGVLTAAESVNQFLEQIQVLAGELPAPEPLNTETP